MPSPFVPRAPCVRYLSHLLSHSNHILPTEPRDALTVLVQTHQTALLTSFMSTLTTGSRTGSPGAGQSSCTHTTLCAILAICLHGCIRLLQWSVSFLRRSSVSMLAAQGHALLRVSLDTANTSLTPPQALLTHAQGLRTILALYTAETEDEDNGDRVNEADDSSGGDGVTIERALDVLIDLCNTHVCKCHRGKGRSAPAVRSPCWRCSRMGPSHVHVELPHIPCGHARATHMHSTQVCRAG
jgi:hypothetical protein